MQVVPSKTSEGGKIRGPDIVTPITVKPGDMINITYRWQGGGLPEGDYKVFVHFTDTHGNMLFQDDHWPLLGTSNWSRLTEYSRTITIPYLNFGGEIQVRLGLYDANDVDNDSRNERMALDTTFSENDGFLRYIAGTLQYVFTPRKQFLPGIYSTFKHYNDLVELYIRINKEECSDIIYSIEISPDAQMPQWESIEAFEAPKDWNFEKIGNGIRFYTETNPLTKCQGVTFRFRVKTRRISWYMRIHAMDEYRKDIGMIISRRWWLYYDLL
ncbi:MAG: hypothetical protein HXS48_17035 [Theionarchaea archaeon]|nr:hypothetical protein [Theionarchaea archaeon]